MAQQLLAVVEGICAAEYQECGKALVGCEEANLTIIPPPFIPIPSAGKPYLRQAGTTFGRQALPTAGRPACPPFWV